MRKTSSLLVLAPLGLAIGLAVGIACSEDLGEMNRGEAPPPTVDAGGDGGDGGEESLGCPGSPPRVGETCPRPESTEQICTYEQGGCTINGERVEKTSSYRCYQGTWHDWNSGPSPCDT